MVSLSILNLLPTIILDPLVIISENKAGTIPCPSVLSPLVIPLKEGGLHGLDPEMLALLHPSVIWAFLHCLKDFALG